MLPDTTSQTDTIRSSAIAFDLGELKTEGVTWWRNCNLLPNGHGWPRGRTFSRTADHIAFGQGIVPVASGLGLEHFYWVKVESWASVVEGN